MKTTNRTTVCVLTFLLLAGLAACQAEQTTTNTSPTDQAPNEFEVTTSTTTPVEATTSSTQPTTTLSPEDAAWAALPLWTANLTTPGEYRTEVFAVPFQITLPQDWESRSGDQADVIGLAPASGEAGEAAVWIVAVDDEQHLEQTHQRLTAAPQAKVTPLEPTSIGGAAGNRYTAEVNEQLALFDLKGDDFFLLADYTYTFHTLNVHGTITTIAVEALTSDHQAFQAKAQEAINSITWKRPD